MHAFYLGQACHVDVVCTVEDSCRPCLFWQEVHAAVIQDNTVVCPVEGHCPGARSAYGMWFAKASHGFQGSHKAFTQGQADYFC